MASQTVISALAALPVGARCNIWVLLNRGLIIPVVIAIYCYILVLLYGPVSQGLGTTKLTNLIG